MVKQYLNKIGESKEEIKVYSGLLTLQVVSVKNASQPSKKQDSDTSSNELPRMIVLGFTDGFNKITGVEFTSLEKYK